MGVVCGYRIFIHGEKLCDNLCELLNDAFSNITEFFPVEMDNSREIFIFLNFHFILFFSE